jgi:hypothetical protein
MSVIDAWREGWRRIRRAPWLIAGIWTSTVLLALPLALTLRREMLMHLGGSLASESAAAGVNFDWWNEFLAQAGSLGQTFVPSILGFAAVLRNVSGIADGPSLSTPIAAAVALYLLLSVFLSGGVIDRLARGRATGSYGFFAMCGAFFFRLLRLGAIAAAMYWLLFAWLRPLLLDRAYGALTHDLTVERTAFFYRLALYAAFGLILVAINLWMDYAKVRMVVEDRRSAIGAVTSGFRFIRRNAGAAFALYLLNSAVFVALLVLYAVAAPGAWGGAWMAVGFAIAQAYIAARIVVRLLFAASQVVLFQGRLAHAGYVAAPLPRWPDSAAAEAIRP